MISWINGLGERVDFVLPDYLVIDTNGFGGREQSSVTFVDQLLEPRELSLIILIEGSSRREVEDKRENLLGLFNTQFGLGKIRWDRGVGGVYEIEAVVQKIKFVATTDFGQFQEEVKVELVAPDPCWFDPVATKVTINNSLTTIINEGDIFTPTKIVVKGSVENIVVENKSTREKMTLLVNLTFDQRLEINSKIGEKEISLITAKGERINYFKVLTPGSDFITLAPGGNELNCNLAGGQIEIAYYNRYLGI